MAVLYAFLANLRTVADSDLFWQLATGRWVVQHHRVFSSDVFSYTAQGQPWIYPAGSGLILYAAYLIGGYVLLSWMGAAACSGTVGLLLRRGTAASAAIAIVAVPLIAERTVPRAEMFTVVLFAACLSLLWSYHRTGHARLWLLPLLMMAWVNLHLGFVAGLALMATFAGVEILEMPFSGARRDGAVRRLRHAAPWFLTAAMATLANPWGWGIYSAIVRQDRAMALHSGWIAEWGSVPLNWTALSVISLRYVRGAFYLLLAIAAIAALVALLQRQLGAAILLMGSLYPGARHIRMDALTACVVVVVGGYFLSAGWQRAAGRISSSRMRSALAASALAMVAALAVLRSADVVRNYRNHSSSRFGTGLSWWLPERATAFIELEKLPDEIFNTYNVGGYLVWRLGPRHRDYLDGRAVPFGPDIFHHQAELLQSSPDSELWQREAEHYNINTILLPVLRYESLGNTLRTFCRSTEWRPVYLDEISAVFVRRRPETEALIKRSEVDCATAPLPRGSLLQSADGAFNQWANTASILAALGRYSEAMAALDKAGEIFPDSFFVAGVRGSILQAMGLRSDAEREYAKAVSLEPRSASGWFALSRLYQDEGRIRQSTGAERRAIDLSSTPQPQECVKLAHLYLETGQPRAALQALDEAARSAPPDLLAQTGVSSFRYDVALGRAAAWRALGDAKRATGWDEEAVRALVPEK